MTAINGAARSPITDVSAWFDELPSGAGPTLRALGELLGGVTDRQSKSEDAERFTTRSLDVPNHGHLIDEDRELTSVQRLTVGLALAELIAEHAAELGPGEYAKPPAWTQTKVGDTLYRHPQLLRAGFPAGTLLPDAPCVIKFEARGSFGSPPEVTAFAAREHQDGARTVLDRLFERAAELNPFRGRACRASIGHGLELTALDLPAALSRESVIVDASVWAEIDLGICAVRDRHELLNRHGLGARRGVLLVGPPGTGKSAVSAVIAREVVGTFTVIYVEARAGAALLTAVVEGAQEMGGPVVLVLEDVDLWVRDRGRGDGAGLSELLQAMDFAADARILTLASTNDAATLDRAAIRTGRFDSIVEVGYPTRSDAARILAALIGELPGGAAVDTAAVVSTLPEKTSGSDLREIVRRTVLSGGADGAVTAAALLTEVGNGRYKASMPGDGLYL